MARTSSSRATFINNVISQLASYGFDGIDIVRPYFASYIALNFTEFPYRTGVRHPLPALKNMHP